MRSFVWVSAALLAPGCGSEMEAKECDKLRGDAFEVLNEAHHCNSDVDCRLSEWPGCDKPISGASFAKIKDHRDKFTTGKCKEPEQKCRPAPVAYCKQGLCVFREEGSVSAPGAEIKAE